MALYGCESVKFGFSLKSWFGVTSRGFECMFRLFCTHSCCLASSHFLLCTILVFWLAYRQKPTFGLTNFASLHCCNNNVKTFHGSPVELLRIIVSSTPRIFHSSSMPWQWRYCVISLKYGGIRSLWKKRKLSKKIFSSGIQDEITK